MDETTNNKKAKKMNLFSWLLFVVFAICSALFGIIGFKYSLNAQGEGTVSYTENGLIFYESGLVVKENKYSKNKIEQLPVTNEYKVSIWDDTFEAYAYTDVTLSRGSVSNAKEGLLESYVHRFGEDAGYLCIYETTLEIHFSYGNLVNQQYAYIKDGNFLVSAEGASFSLKMNDDGKIDVTVPDKNKNPFTFSVQGTSGSIEGTYETDVEHEHITLEISDSSFSVISSAKESVAFLNTAFQVSFIISSIVAAAILIIQLFTIKMKKDYKIRVRALIEGWIAVIASLSLCITPVFELATRANALFATFDMNVIVLFAVIVILLGLSIAFLVSTYASGKTIRAARKAYLVVYHKEKAKEKQAEAARKAEERRIQEEKRREEQAILAEERRIQEEKRREEQAALAEERRIESERRAKEKEERMLALSKEKEEKRIILLDAKNKRNEERKEEQQQRFLLRPILFLAPLLLLFLYMVCCLDFGIRGDFDAIIMIVTYLDFIAMGVMAVLGAISLRKKEKYYFFFIILSFASFILFTIVCRGLFDGFTPMDSVNPEANRMLFIVSEIIFVLLLIAIIVTYKLIKNQKIRVIVITSIHAVGYCLFFLFSSLPFTSISMPLFIVLRILLPLVIDGTLFFVFYSIVRPFSTNEIQAEEKWKQARIKAKEERKLARIQAKEERKLEKEYDSLNKEFNVTIKNKDFDKAKEIETRIKQYEKEHGLEKASYFDGGLLSLFGWKILGILLTAISFGIAYPWAVCFIKRWEVKHSVINSRRLIFTGTGAQLFVKYIIWWLLSIITLGIYFIFVPLKMEKWVASHTFDVPLDKVEHVKHLEEEVSHAITNHNVDEVERLSKELDEYKKENDILGESYFDGRLFQLIGWNILCFFVKLLTLGIAKPFTTCWMMKWKMKHQVILGRRLSFDGNGLQLIGRYILWFVLTVITFGIYGLWLNIKMKKWETKHIHFVKESEPSTEQ